MKKKELMALLKSLLIALAEREKLPPKPPPRPTPPPPAPPLGHTAYIKPDYSMCCAQHEEMAFQPASEVRWIAFPRFR